MDVNLLAVIRTFSGGRWSLACRNWMTILTGWLWPARPGDHRQLPGIGAQRRQFGGELVRISERSVPLGDGGENRERPFAMDAGNAEAAIRYALALFFLELRQFSETGQPPSPPIIAVVSLDERLFGLGPYKAC